MFYTIYKITNLVNDKVYIGKHQTLDLDDAYMGSGKHLNRAIAKYGIVNFKKEILFCFDNGEDMNVKESELVTEEFCSRDDTYNICIGGKGGFSYINNSGLNNANKDKTTIYRIVSSKLSGRDNAGASARMKSMHENGHINYSNFVGKTHTDESKSKISFAMKEKQQGSKNSQYGTMWITNGQENKKIKKDIDIIPDGWYKGRK